MSLVTQLSDVVTRMATEDKAIRTLLNGNAANLSALNTTAKTNLVAAINEVFAAVGSGGATILDQLTDVVITSAADGDILRFNGTNWVDAVGTTHFQAADTDLAAIAALTSAADKMLHATGAGTWALTDATSYGRALLALANQAALMALLSAATTSAAGIVELGTVAEHQTGTDTTRAATIAGVRQMLDDLIGGAPGALDTLNELAAALGDNADFAASVTTSLAGKQPLDAGLTSISGLTTANNKGIYTTALDTYAVYDLSAYGRTIANFADNAAARTSIDVYSKAEIGDPTTNFVTIFEAGLV